jgi:hypothetical protein
LLTKNCFSNEQKEKRAAELTAERTFKIKKENAAELVVANIELTFQNEEKGKTCSRINCYKERELIWTYGGAVSLDKRAIFS